MTSQVGGSNDRLGRRNRDFIKVRTLSYGSPHPCSPCAVFSTFLLKWITSAAVEQTRRSISISDPFNRNRGHAPKNLEVQTDWSVTINLLKSIHEYNERRPANFCLFFFFSFVCCCCCQVWPWPQRSYSEPKPQTGGRTEKQPVTWGRDGLLVNRSEMLRRSLACLCKWTSVNQLFGRKRALWSLDTSYNASY